MVLLKMDIGKLQIVGKRTMKIPNDFIKNKLFFIPFVLCGSVLVHKPGSCLLCRDFAEEFLPENITPEIRNVK